MPELNKRGQSLIEVVVALSLVAIAFSGAVTLIANLSGLILTTRNKTEAVALAQGKMAELIEQSRTNCSRTIINSDSVDGAYTINDNEYTIDGSGLYYTVNAGVFEEDTSVTDPADADFGRFNILITWNDKRGQLNSYEYSEIIKM